MAWPSSMGPSSKLSNLRVVLGGLLNSALPQKVGLQHTVLLNFPFLP